VRGGGRRESEEHEGTRDAEHGVQEERSPYQWWLSRRAKRARCGQKKRALTLRPAPDPWNASTYRMNRSSSRSSTDAR
jgi:hypothetical protein